MLALKPIKRVINVRLYTTYNVNMSSFAQEPIYESNCPIQIDTFGNKMTYFGEIKSLSHYIDTSNQIFAYHPKEHVYEYVAYWNQDIKLPITQGNQIYKHTDLSKKNFYDIEFFDAYNYNPYFNMIIPIGNYDIKKKKFI